MNIKEKTNFIERTDLMKSYLADLNKLQVMTPAKEKALFDEYYETDDKERKLQIRNEIIEGNQRFIFAIAKRYATDELLNDLISVANLGAIEAFDAYDPSTGNRYTTIAEYYIRRAINAYLTKDNLLVRPSNNTRLASKVKKIEASFYAKHGREPMVSEIKDELESKYGIEVKNPDEILGASMVYLDDSVNNDESDDTIEDVSEYALNNATTNDYVDVMDKEHIRMVVDAAMDKLSEREAIIMRMATGSGYYKEFKDQEIADELGLSSERVRQIRNAATAKLVAMLKPSVSA